MIRSTCFDSHRIQRDGVVSGNQDSCSRATRFLLLPNAIECRNVASFLIYCTIKVCGLILCIKTWRLKHVAYQGFQFHHLSTKQNELVMMPLFGGSCSKKKNICLILCYHQMRSGFWFWVHFVFNDMKLLRFCVRHTPYLQEVDIVGAQNRMQRISHLYKPHIEYGINNRERR